MYYLALFVVTDFSVHFVLDVLLVYSACISLLIWCCNTLADITSVTGGWKNATCFTSSSTTAFGSQKPRARWIEIWHLRKYFRCSRSWRLIHFITSAGISHTPAEKEMWPGSISVIAARMGGGLQQCSLHTGWFPEGYEWKKVGPSRKNRKTHPKISCWETVPGLVSVHLPIGKTPFEFHLSGPNSGNEHISVKSVPTWTCCDCFFHFSR